jgi:hypothetical protein
MDGDARAHIGFERAPGDDGSCGTSCPPLVRRTGGGFVGESHTTSTSYVRYISLSSAMGPTAKPRVVKPWRQPFYFAEHPHTYLKFGIPLRFVEIMEQLIHNSYQIKDLG